jgi:hypothetical protein
MNGQMFSEVKQRRLDLATQIGILDDDILRMQQHLFALKKKQEAADRDLEALVRVELGFREVVWIIVRHHPDGSQEFSSKFFSTRENAEKAFFVKRSVLYGQHILYSIKSVETAGAIKHTDLFPLDDMTSQKIIGRAIF